MFHRVTWLLSFHAPLSQSTQYSILLVFQMLQTFKCLLLFHANVLPGTHACVHVCAILRKLGVGVRSSGTSIDGWL